MPNVLRESKSNQIAASGSEVQLVGEELVLGKIALRTTIRGVLQRNSGHFFELLVAEIVAAVLYDGSRKAGPWNPRMTSTATGRS